MSGVSPQIREYLARIGKPLAAPKTPGATPFNDIDSLTQVTCSDCSAQTLPNDKDKDGNYRCKKCSVKYLIQLETEGRTCPTESHEKRPENSQGQRRKSKS